MNRIFELRKQNKMSQAELGAAVGCTQRAISNYEKSEREIPLKTVEAMCEVFHCTVDYLLGRTDEPTAQLPQGKELKTELMRMLDELAPEDEALVKAFVAGLKASKK